MSQSFVKRPDSGPHSALSGLDVLRAEDPADLKPCPFCGAAAAMRSTGGWHAAGCLTLKCPAQIHALVHRTEKEAAYAWNTRRPAGVDSVATADMPALLRISRYEADRTLSTYASHLRAGNTKEAGELATKIMRYLTGNPNPIGVDQLAGHAGVGGTDGR